MDTRLSRCFLMTALIVSLTISSAHAADADFKQENKPENLQKLFQRVHELLHVKQDAAGAAALFGALVPNAERLKAGLKADCDPKLSAAVLEMFTKFAVNAATAPNICKPEQTVVQVHGATTEAIAKYEKDSVPFKEFPGGAQRVADLILRPGMTYYEVEFLEPGKELGMKYHLLFWDGQQWSMVGPAWRAIK